VSGGWVRFKLCDRNDGGEHGRLSSDADW